MSTARSWQRPEAVGRAWAFTAGAVMLTAFGVAALGSLFYPLGRDQGIFAWVADRILAGGVPFRDAWDQKGPATHYTYALVQLIFGRAAWGVRALDLLAVLATQWAIFGLVRPRAGSFAALVSALFFGALHYRLNDWNTAQPDAWGGMLAIAAIAVLARPTRKPDGSGLGAQLAAGSLIGLATLYKVTLGVMLLPPLVYAIAGALPNLRRATARAVAVGVGFALVIALGLASLAAQGALGDFIAIQWTFNRLVHGGYAHPIAAHLAALHAMALRCGLYLPLLAASAATPLVWRRERALALALWAAIFAGLFALVAQSQYFLYHTAPIFGPLSVLAGIGATRAPAQLLTAWRGGKWWRALSGPALALLVAWSIQPPYNIAGYRTYVFGSLPVADYYERFSRFDFSAPVCREVAGYLRETTRPDDAVLVWAFEPLIAHLANRRTVSRFGFHYPLTACRWPWLTASASLNALCRAYRAEMLDAFRTDPPAVVAIAFEDANILMPRSSRDELERFPELHALILDQYTLDTIIGNFELWRPIDRRRR